MRVERGWCGEASEERELCMVMAVCVFGVGNGLLRAGVDRLGDEAGRVGLYLCTSLFHVCIVFMGSLVRLLAAWGGDCRCAGSVRLRKDEEGCVV